MEVVSPTIAGRSPRLSTISPCCMRRSNARAAASASRTVTSAVICRLRRAMDRRASFAEAAGVATSPGRKPTQRWTSLLTERPRAHHRTSQDRSTRPVPLTRSTVQMLTGHRKEAEHTAGVNGRALATQNYIFAGHDGKPFRPDSLSQAFRRAAARLGLQGVRFHDTRHTHASLMLKAGVHPKIVSERLGHSSVTITWTHTAT